MKTITKYVAGPNNKEFSNKEEAAIFEATIDFNERVYDILGLDIISQPSITPQGMVTIIRENAMVLKKLLQAPKYVKIFKDQISEVKQVKNRPAKDPATTFERDEKELS